MIRNIPVSEIMSISLITVQLESKLEDVKEIFKKKAIRHIPVVNKNVIVGMLSYSDILKASYSELSEDDKDLESSLFDWYTVKQVMTKSLFLVSPSTTIKEVGKLLSEKEFHALPVVDCGELVGIVTSTDLIKYLVNNL
ncbi:MAG: CBS domain-containing protein [Polaribacter sp.]|uniref:CBS domain-containing protein n=1 Tax=Polaribacter sp. TaxID=1920175 RepID=UPI003BAEA145